MLEVLQEGLLRQEYDPTAVHLASVKNIYISRASDVIPPPKVEANNLGVDFIDLVYPRLAHSILEAEAKNILFSLTHNLQPCKQRLFQQQRVQDSVCPLPQCQGTGQRTSLLLLSPC